MKKNFKNQDGFVVIVALSILALLMVFMITLQITLTNTTKSIKNTNNFVAARNLADSSLEYLQYLLKQHGAGYSSGDIKCKLVDGNIEWGGEYRVCQDFKDLLTAVGSTDKVEIEMRVKGRSDETENFIGSCPGMSDGNECYSVPLPGTGDAGGRCNLYDPFAPDISGTPTNPAIGKCIDENGVRIGCGPNPYSDVIAKEIDYSCNWNKLYFGSNNTDRIAIPLYYEDENENIVINPYKDSGAQNFILRVRTPCKPFGVDESGNPLPGHRANTDPTVASPDETICSDENRYELISDNGNNDAVIIQWQINGTCNGEECGLVAYGEGVDTHEWSLITNESINRINVENIVLNSKMYGLNTSKFPPLQTPILRKLTPLDKSPLLSQMDKPVLTLFLSSKIKTSDQNLELNVPYLEYQLLTDYPVGNPMIEMEAKVNVNGNIFEKKMVKPEGKALVDFAIQN